MHLYFYIRGIKNWVDAWLVMAQGLFWKWDRKNLKTGKIESFAIQGALRPSIWGAWEYIFPEEALPDVLAVFNIKETTTGGTKSAYIEKSKLAMLRKLFFAKKIPKEAFEKSKGAGKSIILKNSHRALSHLGDEIIPGIALHPIGIKYDLKGTIKDEKGVEWEQELV